MKEVTSEMPDGMVRSTRAAVAIAPERGSPSSTTAPVDERPATLVEATTSREPLNASPERPFAAPAVTSSATSEAAANAGRRERRPRSIALTVDVNPAVVALWQSSPVASMSDLDELALALPEVTKELSEDGRPSYAVRGKMFCFHRSRRPDAVDSETGER